MTVSCVRITCVLYQDYLCPLSGLPVSCVRITLSYNNLHMTVSCHRITSVLCQDYLHLHNMTKCPVSRLPVSCHDNTLLLKSPVTLQLPSWQVLRLWHRQAAAPQTTSQPQSIVVVMLMYLLALVTGKHLFIYSWFLGHTPYHSPKACLLLPARRRPVLFLPQVRCSLWLFLAAASSIVSFVFHGRC